MSIEDSDCTDDGPSLRSLSLEEKKIIRKYLLGDDSKEVDEWLEDFCIAEEGALELVDEVAHELAAQYLHDRLNLEEKERFEKYFLASEYYQHVLALEEMIKEGGGRKV
jgi:hypothetical protein